MISVADLLTSDRLPANYYANEVYVRGDLEMGLLESRRGDRLLALPQTLLQAIYSGLTKETGQASKLVLFNCGRWWGKNFYNRFREELSDYYGTPLSDMVMADFLQSLKQCWITYGWGKMDLDQTHHHRGFLIVQTWNSPFANQAPPTGLPVCFLEAGILAAFFSQLAGRELYCVQTSCESMEADCNRFIIGLQNRVEPAEALVEGHLDHDAILLKLCG
ncbi:V4R domain-containing protein [Phormidesmis sp. 146-12]